MLKVLSITIIDEGKPVFDAEATTVSIEDDAAGPFITVSQCSDEHGAQKIRLCFDEVALLAKAARKLRSVWESQ